MNKSGFQLKRSTVLEKLNKGEVANCMKLNVSGTRATELAAMQGFDCLWTDMEHGPNDFQMVEAQILAAKLYNVDIVVRTTRNGYSDLIRPLEMDATGIMVPHVMGYEDAKSVLRNVRFHPLGLRPIDGGNADGKYGMLGSDEYMEYSNAEKFIILQIEDPEAVEELEKICSLEGQFMIFFGPGDYSQALGIPGQIKHEEVVKVRKYIAEVAKKYGKFAGTVATPDMIEDLIEEGYQFINLGADVAGLKNYYKDSLNNFSNVVFRSK